MYATRDALDGALGRIPFEVWSVHHDNGKEFLLHVNFLTAIPVCASLLNIPHFCKQLE